jgi:hypothetical protein
MSTQMADQVVALTNDCSKILRSQHTRYVLCNAALESFAHPTSAPMGSALSSYNQRRIEQVPCDIGEHSEVDGRIERRYERPHLLQDSTSLKVPTTLNIGGNIAAPTPVARPQYPTEPILRISGTATCDHPASPSHILRAVAPGRLAR